jgi:hypothetical protein
MLLVAIQYEHIYDKTLKEKVSDESDSCLPW